MLTHSLVQFHTLHKQLNKVSIDVVHVGEDLIQPVTSVQNLGVIFDNNPKMDKHVSKICILSPA